ncbi:hypothetical protein [Psychromonas algicola]|uniref:hypothetical protein n=1 Tax=Psychromonas algicola TaxID=2555642 RepID=UPI0010672DC3|nr:hypothetical protein [Psychromonas sp. RZ5]TEW42874.1 hypothetical protein E2R67_16285 [Psychromonas sp. RZ5]
MNQYYKFSTTGYVDFGVQKAPLLREQSVMQGRVIDPQKLPKLIFEHNFPIGESIPHFLTGGTVLASNKLLTVLESAGVDNYQAIPATLINPNTNEIRACTVKFIGNTLLNIHGLHFYRPIVFT